MVASIRDPIHPSVDVIFQAARQNRLVVCAGAGLSRGAPAELPSGRSLGEDLDARLTGLIAGYQSPTDIANLIAVADAGSGLEGGEPALRGEVLQLADFKGAEPNFGHRATAELLCEGGISLLLLWNWDTCVERVDVSPERLQVSRSRSDLKDLTEPSIAKVHGCATRRETLLITSQDLEKPPVWADEATREHLRGKTVVFVGVGDIADYAKKRLAQLQEELEKSAPGEGLDVWIVSPGIKEDWDDSAWADLLPDLAEERRLAMTADDFLDQLARRWVREALDGLDQATAGVKAATRTALTLLTERLSEQGSVKFLRWSRSAGIGQSVGDAVALDVSLKQLLLGYAVLARDRDVQNIKVRSPAAVELDGQRIEGIVACSMSPAEKIRNRALERARRLADQGVIDQEASFMVAGSIVGTLDDDPELQLDIAAGDQATDDLVAGPSAVRLSFHRASDLETGA